MGPTPNPDNTSRLQFLNFLQCLQCLQCLQFRLCLLFVTLGHLTICEPGTAQAQQRTEDAEFRFAAEGRAILFAKLRLSLKQELRTRRDDGYQRTSTDLGVSYKLSKLFSAGAHHQVIFRDSETRHRLKGDVVARINPDPITPHPRATPACPRRIIFPIS